MNNSMLGRHVHVMLTIAAVGLLALVGCQTEPGDSDTLHFTHETLGVPQPEQELFDSPEKAAGALKDAFQTKDRQALIAIFGQEGRQLVFTGDRIQEENDMQFFAARMAESMRVDHPVGKKAVIYLGKENYPYPIPIMKVDGQWFFDTVAGREELLDRRIGGNELSAIATCRAYVAAQKEYAGKPRMGDGIIQYAQHFMSSPGKKDGLYWEPAQGEALSPLGPEVAAARAEGYAKEPPTAGKHRPYHGYFFRILTAQGSATPGGSVDYIVDGRMIKGFALIAWPDRWGASGIMTFIVNQDGTVYRQNLGPKTEDVVKAINEYNPDKTWTEEKD